MSDERARWANDQLAAELESLDIDAAVQQVDLVERAAALGREHGTAGGSWVAVMEADSYRPQSVAPELRDAYDSGYLPAWRDEVLRMARYQVGES